MKKNGGDVRIFSSSTSKIAPLNDSLYRLGPMGNPPVLSSYLVIDEKVAIVDCGPRSVIDELLSLLRECGFSPSEIDYLLLTHIHLDHAGGTASFLEKCVSAKAFVPERGFKHLLNPETLNSSSRPVLGDRIFTSWGQCDPVPKERAVAVKPHAKINLGGTELEYIPATGHAPHHNVLHDQRRSILFSADALGIYEERSQSLIPTTPPPSFDLEQAIQDIRMIENLKPELACMAHFVELPRPDENYYKTVIKRFRFWADTVELYIKEKKLKDYGLQDCLNLFSTLAESFPEYRALSEDLKEQAARVDVGGLLNYFIRRR